MKIFKLLTATILLSAFSHSAFADEQADAQMIANSTFCAMYSTPKHLCRVIAGAQVADNFQQTY